MTQKYHLISFGCSMNKADAERIARVLENLGFQKTDDISLADFIVINACSVRQSAIDRVYGKALKILNLKKKKNLKAIVTGCILPKDRQNFLNYFDLIFNINDLEKLPYILKESKEKKIPEIPLKEQVVKLEKNNLLSPEEESYLNIYPLREKKFLALVPISTGCNKFCTFCAVPYVRGLEVCRYHKDIIKECELALKEGAKEIVLIGQTVNTYEDKDGVKFSDLLKMIDSLKGDFWISFQSPYPTGFDEKTIEKIKESKKIVRFLNLPLQSGDDNVLKRMNRKYSVKEYREIVQKIRKEIPEISLATDIIVGFCGETKEEFENTAKLMEEIKYDMAFIAKYSPRPGTIAEKYFRDNVPENEKIRRQRILTKIVKETAFERSKKFEGKILDVFVYKKKKNYLYGKSFFGKNVILPLKGNENLIGEFLRVKIEKAFPFVLEGKII